MSDPGLDLQEWDTRWTDLQDQAADAPDEALPDMVRLIQEMLTERGYDVENPVVEENEDPDITRNFLAAREIALAAESTKIDSEDIQTAIEDLTDIYDYLVEDRAGP
jgi:N-acetyl-anhydromuramyl-L-alanine amidase AmpD